MRKRDLDRFKKLLQDERARIIHNANNTKEHIANPNIDDLLDEVDIASSEVNQSVSLRLRDREGMLLSKVEEALGRITAGSYGVCEECGEEIGVKRLEARPVATRCIRCKEEQEKREREYS
jgi:DnaK suppressor protein